MTKLEKSRAELISEMQDEYEYLFCRITRRNRKSMKKLEKSRAELIQEMQDEYGYLFCRACNRSKGFRNLHCHHIIFRSAAPNHPNLHSKENLIIVCNDCHDKIHAYDSELTNKMNREKEARGLNMIKANL